MGYSLGIDLGTTYTAAAVARGDRLEICELGLRTATVPSVVYLAPDGTVLTGDAALRRGVDDPGRLARDFKRRMGDSTPVLLGGTPFGVDALVARQLEAVVATVTEREAAAPASIAVSHPANWGPYKLDLMRQAVARADMADVVLVTEPHAASAHYAGQQRLQPGATVVVYDLGGGTFDVAVMRMGASGFELLGEPEGIERLGGIDFDQSVLRHVGRSVGDAVSRLDPDDPVAQAAMARLHEECVLAKEALSSDTEVSIPVLLPTLQTKVRLTRAEFESMIRPALGDTIVVTHRALRGAGVVPDQVDAMLLVGGSSRIPLIAQMVTAEFGRPIALDAHPKHAVAFGAARLAAGEVTLSRAAAAALEVSVPVVHHGSSNGEVSDPSVAEPDTATAAEVVTLLAAASGGGAHRPDSTDIDGFSTRPIAAPSWPQPRSPSPQRIARRRAAVGAAAALALVIGGGVWVLGRGGDRPALSAAEVSIDSALDEAASPTSVTEPLVERSAPEPTTTAVASEAPVPPSAAATSTSMDVGASNAPQATQNGRPVSDPRPTPAASVEPPNTDGPVTRLPPAGPDSSPADETPVITPAPTPATPAPTPAPTPATPAPTPATPAPTPRTPPLTVDITGHGPSPEPGHYRVYATVSERCVSVQWTYDGQQAHGVSLTCLPSVDMHYDTFWMAGSVPPGPGRHIFTITVRNAAGESFRDTYYLDL